MQFKTNLATRTYIDKKKLNIALTGAIAVLLLLVLVQIKISAFNAGEISRLKAMKATLESRSKKKKVEYSEDEYKKLTDNIKFANGLLAKKAFDWVQLLNNLEAVVPDGLTLTSVQPKTEDKSLTISGVTLNFKNLQQFLNNLEGSHFFYDIYLLRQELKQESKQDESKIIDNRKVLSFTISCKFAM